jgi:hypothetical protein
MSIMVQGQVEIRTLGINSFRAWIVITQGFKFDLTCWDMRKSLL